MKKSVLFMGVFTVLSIALYGQDKTTLSQAEQMSAQSGTLIEKRFEDAGKVKGVEISLMVVKDLVDKKEVRAVKISYTEAGQYSKERSSVLDKDELEGLVTSIHTLETITTETRDAYTEVIYKSRTGFKAGAYYDMKGNKWNGFIETGGSILSATAFLSLDDLKKFGEIVEGLKAKM